MCNKHIVPYLFFHTITDNTRILHREKNDLGRLNYNFNEFTPSNTL